MFYFLKRRCQTGKKQAQLNLGSELTQPSPKSQSVATVAEEMSFLLELVSIKMGCLPLQWCHVHPCSKPTSGHGRLAAASCLAPSLCTLVSHIELGLYCCKEWAQVDRLERVYVCF